MAPHKTAKPKKSIPSHRYPADSKIITYSPTGRKTRFVMELSDFIDVLFAEQGKKYNYASLTLAFIDAGYPVSYAAVGRYCKMLRTYPKIGKFVTIGKDKSGKHRGVLVTVRTSPLSAIERASLIEHMQNMHFKYKQDTLSMYSAKSTSTDSTPVVVDAAFTKITEGVSTPVNVLNGSKDLTIDDIEEIQEIVSDKVSPAPAPAPTVEHTPDIYAAISNIAAKDSVEKLTITKGDNTITVVFTIVHKR